MYRVGVIGLGQIAWSIDRDPNRSRTWSHLGAYASSPAVTVQAVSSRNEAACQYVQAKYKVPSYYTKYREMLAAENLDIVSICTPISTHHDILLACVDARVKAIFCEKTLSFDIAEAEEMVRRCDERGIVLAVNHVRRWDSLHIHAAELIAGRAVGEISTIVACGATALHTSTSHLIDQACAFAGKPAWVVGDDQDGYRREVHGVQDPGANAMIKFESGAVGFVKGTSASKARMMSELDIIGDSGRIRIDGDCDDLTLYRFAKTNAAGSGYESLVETETSVPARNERMIDAVADIVACIPTGQQPRSSGASSLDSLRIIDGIRRSVDNDNSKVLIEAAR